MAADSGHTKKTTDFWGREKEEHFDSDGHKTGETRFSTDWLGRPKQEHYSINDEKTGETRKGSDWLGRDRAEHFDSHNQRIGHSRNETDVWGRPVQRHYDSSNIQVGQTRRTQDWLGRTQKEHEGDYFKSGQKQPESYGRSSSGTYDSSSDGVLVPQGPLRLAGKKSSRSWLILLAAVALGAVIFLPRSDRIERTPQQAEKTLESAKADIPGILNRIYGFLNEGNPMEARSMLSPRLAGSAEKLDYICRPFAYRAHYIEAINERPGQQFQAMVHVLFQPMEERLYVLEFQVSQGQFILWDVTNLNDDWLGPRREAAIILARNFVYAAMANKQDAVAQMTTPGLDVAPLFTDEEYQTRLHEITELKYEEADLWSQQGLKFRVHFISMRGICYDTWYLLVDEIHGRQRIVQWEFHLLSGVIVGAEILTLTKQRKIRT